MQTHWKEISKRVAVNLNLSEEEVQAAILEYAKTLHKGLKETNYTEYDYFYLGKLVFSSRKLTKYWNNIKKLPDKKNFPIIKKLIAIQDALRKKKAKSILRSKNNKKI